MSTTEWTPADGLSQKARASFSPPVWIDRHVRALTRRTSYSVCSAAIHPATRRAAGASLASYWPRKGP